jgi:hypothetical protein
MCTFYWSFSRVCHDVCVTMCVSRCVCHDVCVTMCVPRCVCHEVCVTMCVSRCVCITMCVSRCTVHRTYNLFSSDWQTIQEKAKTTFKLSAHPQQTIEKPQSARVTWSLQFQPDRVCCCNKKQPNLRRLTVTSVTWMEKNRGVNITEWLQDVPSNSRGRLHNKCNLFFSPV